MEGQTVIMSSPFWYFFWPMITIAYIWFAHKYL